MKDKIKLLKPASKIFKQSEIDCIEEFYQDFKAGKINNFLISFIESDQNTNYYHSNMLSTTLFGLLECTRAQITDSYLKRLK